MTQDERKRQTRADRVYGIIAGVLLAFSGVGIVATVVVIVEAIR